MLPEWVFDETDRGFMEGALADARRAGQGGEVPVGAVLVRNNEILSRAGNLREASHDPTAHAEILVLRDAGQTTGDWRLEGCTLYVTLEPCPMCLHACRQARVDLIIWGAPDPVMGRLRIDCQRRRRPPDSPGGCPSRWVDGGRVPNSAARFFCQPARFVVECPPRCGEVPEWSIGAVSKTVDLSRGPRVRIPSSPPVLSESDSEAERCPSGRRSTLGKRVWG